MIIDEQRLLEIVDDAAADERWLDDYLLEEKLGEGATGVVYAARSDDMELAIKVFHPQFATAESDIRVEREVSLLRGLSHRSIVRVLDGGRGSEGELFIVMERLTGTSLDEADLSLEEFLDLMEQVLEGLGAAHERGLVHRDLKPANIFVCNDGTAKVIDFGLVRETDGGKSATATGEALGTPYYMSPEQATSPKDVDARSDVWSIGIMLYEALTGVMPFDGQTIPGLLVAICTEDPRPLPGVPVALGEVALACLNRDPEERPTNASALLSRLRQARRSPHTSTMLPVVEPPVAIVAAPTRGSRWLWLVLAGALVLVAAIALMLREEEQGPVASPSPALEPRDEAPERVVVEEPETADEVVPDPGPREADEPESTEPATPTVMRRTPRRTPRRSETRTDAPEVADAPTMDVRVPENAETAPAETTETADTTETPVVAMTTTTVTGATTTTAMTTTVMTTMVTEPTPMRVATPTPMRPPAMTPVAPPEEETPGFLGF